MKNGVPINEQGEKWWLDSSIIRKALLLVFPAISAILGLFNLPFSQDIQDGILAAVTLSVTAYVGITLMIDRWKVSKHTTTTPITFSKPN